MLCCTALCCTLLCSALSQGTAFMHASSSVSCLKCSVERKPLTSSHGVAIQSVMHHLIQVPTYPILPYPSFPALLYITLSLSRSVGVVAWELFTGECPYEGMTHIEVRYAALTSHIIECRTISLVAHCRVWSAR
jgi:hypothetical protein